MMAVSIATTLLGGLVVLVTLTRSIHCASCTPNTDFGTNNPNGNDQSTFSDTDAGYILGASTADCCGVVTEWQADFKTVAATTIVYFQVWRLTSGTTYELLGENPMTVTDNNENTITVTGTDQILFDSGDKFGWWASGTEVVGYKGGGAEADNNWKIVGLPDYTTGDTHDWNGKTVINDVTFAVRVRTGPDNAPTLPSLPDAATILTTDAAGSSISTIIAADVDTNDVINIAMATNTQFDFNTTTNELTLGTLTSSSGTQTLTFTVTDLCGNTDTGTFTVTIVNPPPVIHDTPAATNTSEDASSGTLMFTINVTDADVVTCSMSASVSASYPFAVRLKPSSTDYGIYYTAVPVLSYNTQDEYILQVDCTDGVSTVTSNNYYVYVIPNATPAMTNLQNAAILTTNTGSGVNIFNVTITDAEGDNINCSLTSDPPNAPFEIFDSGAVQTTQDLSSETTVGYDLFISCSDTRNTVGPETLTITFSDLNNPVTLSNLPIGSALTVAENTVLGTSVYNVSFTDVDTSQTHTFIMTSAPAAGLTYFAIDPSTGLITTSGTVVDYEALGGTYSFTFDVTVADPVTQDTQSLVVDVYNVNEPPVFSPTAYSITAVEGTAGTVIGTPSFGVTDPDNGDSITLSMDCGPTDSYFLLNIGTSAVSYQLDYDLDTGSLPTTASCNVTATDTGGLNTTATLDITINDINDNSPVCAPCNYTFFISYYISAGATVGYVTATDADTGSNGNITFTLDQSSLAIPHFDIDNNGTLRIQLEPTSSSSVLNYSSAYTILAKAEDIGGNVATATVTIVVTDTTTTTTTASTTASYTYKTFFEDAQNLAWFIPCMILVFVTLIATVWVCHTCRGQQGWRNFAKNFMNRKKMWKQQRTHPNRSRHPDPFETGRGPKNMSVRCHPPPIENQRWRIHQRF